MRRPRTLRRSTRRTRAEKSVNMRKELSKTEKDVLKLKVKVFMKKQAIP